MSQEQIESQDQDPEKDIQEGQGHQEEDRGHQEENHLSNISRQGRRHPQKWYNRNGKNH